MIIMTRMRKIILFLILLPQLLIVELLLLVVVATAAAADAAADDTNRINAKSNLENCKVVHGVSDLFLVLTCIYRL